MLSERLATLLELEAKLQDLVEQLWQEADATLGENTIRESHLLSKAMGLKMAIRQIQRMRGEDV